MTQENRRTREFDTRLAEHLAAVRKTSDLSKSAARLAAAMLTVLASRRVKDLAEDDAVLGSMAAALLTALACGMSRAEYVAWLRRTARILAQARRRSHTRTST